jgi:hypothetical protein
VNVERTVSSKVRKDVTEMKMDKHKQSCVMKFFFLQGKRYKVMYRELNGVLGEADISLATVRRWCQRFIVGNFSLNGEIRSARLLTDLAQVISQFVRDESFLSSRVLAKGPATSPLTIKGFVARGLSTRTFTPR